MCLCSSGCLQKKKANTQKLIEQVWRKKRFENGKGNFGFAEDFFFFFFFFKRMYLRERTADFSKEPNGNHLNKYGQLNSNFNRQLVTKQIKLLCTHQARTSFLEVYV